MNGKAEGASAPHNFFLPLRKGGIDVGSACKAASQPMDNYRSGEQYTGNCAHNPENSF